MIGVTLTRETNNQRFSQELWKFQRFQTVLYIYEDQQFTTAIGDAFLYSPISK